MTRILAFILAAMSLMWFSAAAQESGAKKADSTHPVVVMETNIGTMEITLDAEKAPITVRNFLSYAREGFYDSTIFHRVISGFMIQGGGYALGMAEKATKAPIKNEAANGLLNKRGTIAMARRSEINSATSQFFINHADNPSLDHKDDTPRGFGYAVFGEVNKGIEVVDKIAAIPTGTQDVPMKPVVILFVKIKK